MELSARHSAGLLISARIRQAGARVQRGGRAHARANGTGMRESVFFRLGGVQEN
ncbi:hypothetical protein IMZ29_04110 [Achromobacter sp. GG226]|uniref:hypothetical protein n=1 Tax=Verticiella alkaliphila TaxID=2779529 RepID=UPI001C0E2E22|nr:hypothetical protein [Verticiella sp. GG226]MBU4609760.1 hypothetical protein [Verticiella sp. GG226]